MVEGILSYFLLLQGYMKYFYIFFSIELHQLFPLPNRVLRRPVLLVTLRSAESRVLERMRIRIERLGQGVK